VFVRPEAVVGWHRRGWRLVRRWRWRCRLGRPRPSAEVREPIATMARDNPSWGAERIGGEPLRRGIAASNRSIRRYRPGPHRPPSPTWRTYLRNRAAAIRAADLFTVQTLTFQTLSVLLFISHGRRELMRVSVRAHPTGTALRSVSTRWAGSESDQLTQRRGPSSVPTCVVASRRSGEMAVERRVVTAEELLRLPDDGVRRELIDGELRTMSPTGAGHGEHESAMTFHIGTFLASHPVGRIWGGEVGFLLRRDPDRVRAPDIAIMRRDRVPPAGFFAGPPDMAIEIVSPGDAADAVEQKVQEWLAAGAEVVWVVYPTGPRLAVRRPDGSAQTHGPDEDVEGGPVLPGLRMRLSALLTPPGLCASRAPDSCRGARRAPPEAPWRTRRKARARR